MFFYYSWLFVTNQGVKNSCLFYYFGYGCHDDFKIHTRAKSSYGVIQIYTNIFLQCLPTILFIMVIQLSYNWLSLWEKMVFCNWPCNSIFQLHWTLATHCIYMLWILLDKLQELQLTIYIGCNSLQLYYNFVTTTPFQLLCNSSMTIIIMSHWCHFSSIHQNLTHAIMKIFHDFFEILISIIHYDYSF